MADGVRLDKWLWAARFFPTRARARDAILGGKVAVDGKRAKPGRGVRVGDRVSVQRGSFRFDVAVLDTGDRRVSADRLGEKYLEDPASAARRQEQVDADRRARQERTDRHRPDKRQRRQIVRFTRRDR